MATATFQFVQFFYLQNYQTTQNRPRLTRGGVVLLPRREHELFLYLNGKSVGADLRGCRIYVAKVMKDGTEERIWGEPTVPPTSNCLPRARDIVGGHWRPHRELLTGPVDPDRLNARVMLSGGTFAEVQPLRPESAGIFWTFPISAGQRHRQRLTDRLDYAFSWVGGTCRLMVDRFVDGVWQPLLRHDLADGDVVTLWNQDAKDRGKAVAKRLPQKEYTLDEYRYMFLEVFDGLPGQNAVAPIGDYPSKPPTNPCPPGSPIPLVVTQSATNPICGGVQGDPDPPDDPEEPPDPFGG